MYYLNFVQVYLALPINKSLTECHCLILPLHHVIGQTFMDEDVLQEVKVSLVRGVVFIRKYL